MNYTKRKSVFSVGVKYNINNLTKFSNQNLYKKAFIYTNLSDRFGCTLKYDYRIVERKDFNINVSYNFELFESHRLNDWYFAIGSLIDFPTTE
ncbi:hypothetical protein DNU06_00835 [Putridiphycobacter roseus]|uniref:Uncharacterized protein n=1 Tax=Putridiphycobacter roseus TaxID=2219161 RepID=A0A2W1NH34_9FLAO|nr:hypothetical protein [Putridiphycobacter roseus]PZE18413.1 hypothetical protein DNU06_00835 [Putridiphycobacter roseus]